MNKLKVSWSVLSAWQSGDQDRAIQMIAGLSTPTNAAMERGKRLHAIVAKNKLKLIPDISDSAVFEGEVNGKRINYFQVSINEWLDLSLVIDVLDKQNELLIDWKASKKRSTEQNKLQLYLYALALNILGIPINFGIFATIDEVNDEVFCREYSQFKINEEKLLLAENYLETVGGEIYNFINSQNG